MARSTAHLYFRDPLKKRKRFVSATLGKKFPHRSPTDFISRRVADPFEQLCSGSRRSEKPLPVSSLRFCPGAVSARAELVAHRSCPPGHILSADGHLWLPVVFPPLGCLGSFADAAADVLISRAAQILRQEVREYRRLRYFYGDSVQL